MNSSLGSSDLERPLLDYYSMLNDVAILSRGMNWSLRDIKRLSVRERRHWSKWVSTIVENARTTR